jgi:hypothetical protein
MTILLADAFASDLPARLKPFGDVVLDLGRVSDAEVIIVRSKTKVDKAMIDAAPKLKYVIRGGVGVDTIDVDYAKSKGIVVDNTPEASSLAVAELAFALMIALPNHIAEADASMKQGKWLKKELERTELGGKTLGLVGIGRIARELAIRAKAFGMNVIAYDKYVQSSDAAVMTGLDNLLAASDYISLHTPLTDETRGMIDARDRQDEEGRLSRQHLPRPRGQARGRRGCPQSRRSRRLRDRRLRQGAARRARPSSRRPASFSRPISALPPKRTSFVSATASSSACRSTARSQT